MNNTKEKIAKTLTVDVFPSSNNETIAQILVDVDPYEHCAWAFLTADDCRRLIAELNTTLAANETTT